MKKLILNIKNGEISLIETPVPKIGEGEVLIKNRVVNDFSRNRKDVN